MKDNLEGFYLTGGTALSRFYLGHRYSEDLDFFINRDEEFSERVQRIRDNLSDLFEFNDDKLILSKDFVRVWVVGNETELKLEFVNDVKYHWETKKYQGLNIDSITDILSNKLTAIVNRDEPKDIFDIVRIANNYSFNWENIFNHSIKKSVVAEADVAERIKTFPVELMKKVDWEIEQSNLDIFKKNIDQIADDFLFAQDNSLGKGKPDINDAEPVDLQI